GPGRVVDLGAPDPPQADGVQAVALGQEVLERSGAGVEGLADRPVADAERRGAVRARRGVSDLAPDALDGHPRAEVGEAVRDWRREDRRRACGVEAEEVDAGPPADGDVGPDVGLLEPRQHRWRRKTVQPEARDLEWGDRDPGAVLVGVELE